MRFLFLKDAYPGGPRDGHAGIAYCMVLDGGEVISGPHADSGLSYLEEVRPN
ncbi:hypothetical protein ABZ470_14705 [Streptosporangium sp. NPDC020072]|uniref:hypothetical protein n=1 Tax=Streptosporangium sp. NPDC020072 TaxID=3154788 RepID=UPI0034123F02